MCNLLINWRFGCVHFQVGPDRPHFRLSRNEAHARGGELRGGEGWRWFEAY